MSLIKELYDAVCQYQEMLDNDPLAYGARFGCDCGCGGDSITEEDLDNHDDDRAAATVRLTTAFSNLGLDAGELWRNDVTN
jgi:hypothetical protein